ncbi:hypothetical protein [Dactylosporangium sp. CA-139066]|uniref:hypothetical protein n=1 Tax=Dactylosporangium sp. CA-139066 TaxID=3239930 RepID=UPI003D8BC4D5
MSLNTPCSAIPYAELTDIPNMQTITQNMATALDTKVIPKFASSTARNAAIPSPVTGMACYRTDTKQFELYDGTTWRIVVPDGPRGILARRARTTASTGTTSEQGVIRLAASVVSGRAYRIWTSPLVYLSNTANDVVAGRLRYTTDGSNPTTSSTILTQGSAIEPASISEASAIAVPYYPATSHTLTVMLSCVRIGGTGTVSLNVGTANPTIDLVIEDMGLAVANSGTDL